MNYEIIVVGAGHAGCEAALASARIGHKTLLITGSYNNIATMPCNPSIGGSAKGIIVREIDALGGEMGKVADLTFLQSRILNKGKGPAVYSLRAQIDRNKYKAEMKHRLENQENLHVRQAEIVDVQVDENNNVCAVVSRTGAIYPCRAAILSTGTYLKSRIIIGEFTQESGPDGVFPANELSGNLEKIGVEL